MLDLPDPYYQLFRQAACTAMLRLVLGACGHAPGVLS